MEIRELEAGKHFIGDEMAHVQMMATTNVGLPIMVDGMIGQPGTKVFIGEVDIAPYLTSMNIQVDVNKISRMTLELYADLVFIAEGVDEEND